jgi:hypothetical protein
MAKPIASTAASQSSHWISNRSQEESDSCEAAPVPSAAARSIAGGEMVNRENYLLTKAYLGYLREVAQLDVRSTGRYWFYLRHLLLWADATPFSQASVVQPTFPTYLSTVRAGGGAETLASKTCQGLSPATLKKIAQTAKRFFTWAK